MENKTYDALRAIYQHCCDCQDLAESVGNWSLMETLKIYVESLIVKCLDKTN